MAEIGIAISTRNRQAHLPVCLAHFIAYYPNSSNVRIIVCDDNSDVKYAEVNKKTCESWGVEYHYHSSRMGVSANKNFGLYMLQDCDFVFLFDDDCFPNDNGWEKCYLNAFHLNHVNHLTYTPWMPKNRIAKNGIYTHEIGMGCCMFFSRKIIEAIGGFDEKYYLFGFEHLAYGRRAFASGMNQDYGPYLSPVSSIGKIFTMDYEYKTLKKQPSICTIEFNHIRSASIETPESVINQNRELFYKNQDDLYVPITYNT
jgi:glycosyltransferase involved in cell wall biosynthesis